MDSHAPKAKAPAIAKKSTRVAAGILDSLIIGILAGLISAVVTRSTGDGWQVDTYGWRGMIAGYVLLFLNDVVWVHRSGRTFGKKALGIRIVQMSDSVSLPTWRQTIIRCAVKWAVVFAPLAYVPGIVGVVSTNLELFAPVVVVVWLLVDRIGRGPHDKLAKTVVVESTDTH
jgi:uncharacterized RDD family membrane protein YckC